MPQIDEANGAVAGFAVNRRGLIVKGGAMAAASVVAAGIASPAFAALSEENAGIMAVRGPYAIHGGSVIDGFMAAPKGGGEVDVVVVVGADGRAGAAQEAAARRYAKAGCFALAPDLHTTFGGNGASARGKLKALEPMLAYLPRSSGRVRFVTA